MQDTDGTVAQTKTEPTRDSSVESRPRGDTVGRYVILDVLGTGATGVVYSAYDPELMRRVALKLLRPRAEERQGVRAARIRMLREAQAMARLSHRNVVAVYDVGATAEHLYIAMELVDGTNLRQWLGGRAHRWREVVPMLVAAGRGLAAAHAHGLVHRDFKPENVLVASDGRICVSDFGLARPDPSSGVGDEASGDNPSGNQAQRAVKTGFDVMLTVEGDTFGTPAYMAPEQHRGAPADARVDQYAFALVLYEAIYGRRPFAADDALGLLAAKLGPRPEPRIFAEDGERRWPVPGWLRAAMRRAMAPDPAERWPSMDALLAALAHGPARRRTWLGACGAIAGVAAIVATTRVAGQHPPCEGAGRPPDGWDDSTRIAISEALADADAASGDAVGVWTVASLDRTALQWAAVHRELCEATWVRGEQSPELLDARMTCLQRVWADVDATIALLRAADSGLVANAPELVGELPDPHECRATTGVTPADVDRERWTTLTDALARADALHRAGRERDAVVLLDEHLPAARSLGEPRLLAEMLATRGDLEDELGHPDRALELLREALALAKSTGDGRLEAEAWLGLAYVEGYTRHHYEDGRFYGALSLAAIEAEGGDDRLQAWADNTLGAIAFVEGDDAEARTRFEAALTRRRAILGAEHPLVASSLNNLGGVLYAMNDLAGAEAMLAESLAMRERLFGADHPAVAESAINLGLVHVAAARPNVALPVIEHALAIMSAVHPPDHPDVGRAHDAMAGALLEAGDPKRALEHAERAIAIYRATYGTDHPAFHAVREHEARALAELRRHQ